VLWKWRARRRYNPIAREERRAMERVTSGADDWKRWWRDTGRRELRCILMTAWDPIGVSDAAEAWDEYENYEAGVAYRLRDAPNHDETRERVAEYLNHVELDFMDGVSAGRMRENGYLATALVAWHEWSYEHGGRPPHEWLPEG
jgi:hypothetical protein